MICTSCLLNGTKKLSSQKHSTHSCLTPPAFVWSPLQYEYDFYPTFPDFFKFLLDEEEKMREEETKS